MNRILRPLFVSPRGRAVIAAILLGSGCFAYFYYDKICFASAPKKYTFRKLEKIRSEKKEKVIRYLDQQYRKGNRFSENENVTQYFRELLSLYKQKAYNSPGYDRIEKELEEFFVLELGEFYDMLFISNQGDIFFTLKKEDDFLTNIHQSSYDNVELYKKIRKATAGVVDHNLSFVDYDYYPVSDEPASFFISPVTDNGQTLGYIVLQLAINHINYILTDRESLGRTGEVYLINEKQVMVTQSRFIDDNTILNKVIDTEAVKSAFKEGKGNKIIDDYREKRVFSSYEMFEYKGAKWIIIAEIDEDEVITDLYLSRQDKLFDRSIRYLEQLSFAKDQNTVTESFIDKMDKIKVDVKEAVKTKDRQVLYTRGVATCTAFTISYPGKFGYMAHITPTDDVYENIDWDTRIFLKDKYTNFVDTLMENISDFDITRHQRSQLRFGVFATKSWSLKKIVRKLIENQIDLSQIKILYNNQYDLVRVVFDYDKDRIWTQWNGHQGKTLYAEHYKQIPDFGEIVKKVSNYHDAL